jgi:hypothetical protein
MIMPPTLRKFALTIHITASVGWLGAVATFLALAITGLTSDDTQQVRSAYLAMEMVTSFIIIPFCLASLLSGLVQSLGTKWGLFRHYWVLAKLLITLLATLLLFVHMEPIRYMASTASETIIASTDLRPVRIQLVVDSGAALLALLLTTFCSVYKPRGVTPYGWRMQQQQLARGTAVDH